MVWGRSWGPAEGTGRGGPGSVAPPHLPSSAATCILLWPEETRTGAPLQDLLNQILTSA